MIHVRSFNRFILISLALLGLSVSSVNAATIVSVTPDTTINVGDSLTVEVGISGLNDHYPPSLKEFFIDLRFDQSLFAPAGPVIFGQGLDLGGFGSSQNVFFAGGDIFAVNERADANATILGNLQPDTFLLFSIDFLAIAPGPGHFDLMRVVLEDPFGLAIPFDAFDATVNVRPPNVVPVPAAVWLFGTALIGLVGLGKRRKVA